MDGTQHTARHGPHQVAKKSTTTCAQTRSRGQAKRAHAPRIHPNTAEAQPRERKKQNSRPAARPYRIASAARPCDGPRTGNNAPRCHGADCRPRHPSCSSNEHHRTDSRASQRDITQGKAETRSSNRRHAGMHPPPSPPRNVPASAPQWRQQTPPPCSPQ